MTIRTRPGPVVVLIAIAGLGVDRATARQVPVPAPATSRPIVRPSSQVVATARPPARPPAPPVADGPIVTFSFHGATYRAVPTADRGESDEEERRERDAALRPMAAAPGDGEHFAGSARKAAKTSFATGSTELIAGIADLLDSILGGASPAANDAAIRPTLNARSPRSAIEERNVTVTAFLYATKKETDDDFHLLLGDAPGATGRYMTVEVSGLPTPDNATTPAFQAVRDSYRAFFRAAGLALPGPRYVRFDPPVPVSVTGSIFFDVDHTAGQVRSGDIVPETVWEVHPLSALVFGRSSGP